jgi:hypothetical protein
MLKAEPICFPETSINFYHTARRYIPEESTIQCDSDGKTNPLILFGDIIEIYSENFIRQTIILYGQKCRVFFVSFPHFEKMEVG